MKKNILIWGLSLIMVISFTLPAYGVEEDKESIQDKEELEAQEQALSLSLQEAVDYALKYSKDIEIKEIELQKAEISYEQNTRAVKEVKEALEQYSKITIPFLFTEDNDVNRVLLKNGAIERTFELNYKTAKWDRETTINKIKYDVEKAYFDLLLAEKELAIAEESLNLARNLYEQGKLKYQLGNISKQQLLALELNLSQAQSAYDSYRLNYDIQMMTFKNILGIPFSKEVVLTDTIEYKEHEQIDLKASIEEALKNNVGIRMAEENYEIAQLMLKGIEVKYPDITFKYKTQEAEVAKAAKNLENIKKAVEMGVRTAYLNLITAEKQIETYEKAVEQAEMALKITKTSFQLGMATPVDVAKANIDLMNAKKNLFKQIHAYNMALLNYQYSIGIGMGNSY